jgi:2,3-dihydroxybiphenyl 1,2-dioxygenase
MTAIRALGYAGYTATDLPAWKAFAQGVLGLQLGEEGPDGTLYFRADSYKRRIVIHPGETDDIAYAGWEVADAERLEAVRKMLNDAGVPFDEASREDAKARDVIAYIHFKDPEGLRIEVFYGATELNHDPFRSPLGRPGFITDQQGLGHLVLAAKDYQGQTDFYHRVLGFKISDYNGLSVPGLPFEGELTFFHVNPRHHSLALGNFPLPRKFNHLMFEVESMMEVGLAYDRAKASGAHILMELGQHTNDKVVSFYVVTPSGWSVEIGWGSITIDDEIWHVTHHPQPSAWGHKFTLPPRPGH